MSLRQRAVDAVMWAGIRNWGSQAASFLVFLVLARLLPPEAFGLVAYASVLMALCQVLANQGFALAIVQRETVELEHIDTAFWTGIGVSVALMALIIGLSEPIAVLVREPQLTPLLPWLSLSLVLAALSSVHSALLQRELRYRPLALRTLLATTTGGIAGVTAAISGLGVWSLVIQQLASSSTAVVVLWTSSSWRPGLRVSRAHFRDLFDFGILIVGSNLARFFAARSDRLLIGYLLGPTELGIYVIAFRIIQALIDFVNITLRQVAMPLFARMQNDLDRMRQAFYSATRVTSLVSFPAFVGLAAVAPTLVPALFGNQWQASVPIMSILAFHGIIHSIQYNGAVMVAMGKPAWSLAESLASSLITVVGILIAARWGITGVAAVVVLRGYLVYPGALLAVRSLIHVRVFELLAGYVAPALGSIVVALVATGITSALVGHVDAYATLAAAIAGAALSYALLIRVFAPKRWEATRGLFVLALPNRLGSAKTVRQGPRV